MNLVQRYNQIRDELKGIFVSKDALIDVVMTALVAKQHVMVFGPPGTAKSAMADHFALAITGSKIFNIQLNGDTHPDELLGPVSIKGLVEDEEYRRNWKGYVPDSHIALVDEIFSGNSIVRESLRGVLNERRIFSAGQIIQCPLVTMIAGSNEQPESPEDSIYDRFVFRIKSEYLGTKDELFRLLKGDKIDLQTSITLDELAQMQGQCANIVIPEAIFQRVVEIRVQLSEEGSISPISDRRLFQLAGDVWKGKKVSSLIKAAALLNEKTEVEIEDLEVLKDCCWSKPAEIKPSQQIVMRNVDVFATNIMKLENTIAEFCANMSSGVIANDEFLAFCDEIDRNHKNYVQKVKHPKAKELLTKIKTAIKTAKTAADKSDYIDKDDANNRIQKLEKLFSKAP